MPQVADDVAVVIVTYNSESVIAGCLESLPDGLAGIDDWSVVVVDNDSEDETVGIAKEAAEQLPAHLDLVNTGRNAGYAAAINMGIDRCDPQSTILVLNPDVRLGEASVVELLRALKNPGVGIAVSTLLHDDGSIALSLRRTPTIGRAMAESLLGGRRSSRIGHLGEVVGDPEAYQREGAVDWATGALVAVSPECRRATGAWDERFFLYSEETDFCLRAADRGYRTWFTPGVPSTHIGGESGTSPYLWSLVAVNRVRAYRKRHGVAATALYWIAVTLGEAMRAATGSSRHRAALLALLGRRPAPPQ